MKPNVYLLCGLPGTGKTTYAKRLENQSFVRYSLDEYFLSEHRGQTLTPEEFVQAEERIKEQMLPSVEDNLKNGKSVVLD